MRCVAIARAAIDRGLVVRAFLDGDETAVDRLGSALPEAGRPLAWSRWTRATRACVTLIDLPGETHAAKLDWLHRLHATGSRSVLIDDLALLGRADLSVCPGLHHPSEAPTASRAGADRYLGGPGYVILGEAHRRLAPDLEKRRRSLLLSLGGADPHRVTPWIAPRLARILEESQVDHGIERREVVLGPAYHDPGDRTRDALTRAGWQVHRALPSDAMADAMARARLAVMGFGTSLGELAWHGTPHASVTHHPSDDVPARQLEDRGIGCHLGCARALDATRVETRFRRVLEDPDWQRRSARVAFEAIEGGRGVERLLDRLAERFGLQGGASRPAPGPSDRVAP